MENAIYQRILFRKAILRPDYLPISGKCHDAILIAVWHFILSCEEGATYANSSSTGFIVLNSNGTCPPRLAVELRFEKRAVGLYRVLVTGMQLNGPPQNAHVFDTVDTHILN